MPDLPFCDRPYRPCVGIMLLNRKGEVFVGQRIDQKMVAWQMPQGGIDPGETPRDAALRELAEETGTSNAEIIAELNGWLHYDLPEDIADKIWQGRFRGQKQKWFAMRFLGEDRDIDLTLHQPEFEQWRWLAMAALPEHIVPFKLEIYRQVVAGFRHLLSNSTAELL